MQNRLRTPVISKSSGEGCWVVPLLSASVIGEPRLPETPSSQHLLPLPFPTLTGSPQDAPSLSHVHENPGLGFEPELFMGASAVPRDREAVKGLTCALSRAGRMFASPGGEGKAWQLRREESEKQAVAL